MTERYKGYMERWLEETPLLKDFPNDWAVVVLSEKDPRINPDSWKLGQIGMVVIDGKMIIKPAYQEGVKEGELRVIFVGDSHLAPETGKTNFYEDVLG